MCVSITIANQFDESTKKMAIINLGWAIFQYIVNIEKSGPCNNDIIIADIQLQVNNIACAIYRKILLNLQRDTVG